LAKAQQQLAKVQQQLQDTEHQAHQTQQTQQTLRAEAEKAVAGADTLRRELSVHAEAAAALERDLAAVSRERDVSQQQLQQKLQREGVLEQEADELRRALAAAKEQLQLLQRDADGLQKNSGECARLCEQLVQVRAQHAEEVGELRRKHAAEAQTSEAAWEAKGAKLKQVLVHVVDTLYALARKYQIQVPQPRVHASAHTPTHGQGTQKESSSGRVADQSADFLADGSADHTQFVAAFAETVGAVLGNYFKMEDYSRQLQARCVCARAPMRTSVRACACVCVRVRACACMHECVYACLHT
jgi:hypothetical protein